MTVNLSLDTFKVRILDFESHVRDLNDKAFKTNFIEDKAGISRPQKILKDEFRPIGCSSFSFYPDSNTAILEGSAKILKDDYRSGICLATLDHFSSAYNGAAFQLDNEWVHDSIMYKFDVTQNIKPTDLARSINDLRLLSLNDDYIMNVIKDTTVEFKGKAKSNPHKQKLYLKMPELLKKKNKHIIKLISPKTVNSFLGDLRVERSFTVFSDMRDGLSIPQRVDNSIYLMDVLKSSAKPNLTLLKTISSCQLPLFAVDPKYDEYKRWEDVVKWNGIKNIIIDCKYDLNILMNRVKDKYTGKGKPTRYRKIYAKYIAELKANSTPNTLTSSIQEILDQLAV